MRRLLLFAAVLFAAIQVSAAPVDAVTAQRTAQRFVQGQSYSGRFMAPITGEMKLVYTEMNSQMPDRAVYYVFNSHDGFVIVSGDDRAEEILGYGDYQLDMNAIPTNMRVWLGTYKDQLEYLQAHEELVVVRPSDAAAMLKAIPSVDPLLTANWDQEAPYWNQCKINNYQCYTGCPATSAAMVMHYWKYPDYPTPVVPGYKCNLSTGYYSSTSVNVPPLPSVTFDWDNMLDDYTSGYNTDQANAVATLMRYVGQAERMEYGTSSAGGSGISSDSVSLIADMFKFFGYDEETVRVVKKTSSSSGGQTYYNDAEWAALIQEELIEGRPIVFCAISGGWFGGGHAFNVDGYNATTNKYHINWGWSGDYNNYFALNSFNGAGSTYNQYQQMVIGVQPPIKIPRLKIDVAELSMTCYKNQTATGEFTLKGTNLEADATVTLNDPNGVFSISETVLPMDQAKEGKTIVVTYAPTKEGSYDATITCSTPNAADVVVTVHGSSDYELYKPVLAEIDETALTATSFRADWTDQTPEENVVSYTLEVKEKPAVSLLTEADWSNVPKETTNHAGDAQNYLPDDWSFSGKNLYLDGGYLSMGRNSVLTVNTDLMGYDKVSIILRGMAYPNYSYTLLRVSTSVDIDTIRLMPEVDTYLVVLDVVPGDQIAFTAGYYPEIQSIQIYGGEITDLDPFVQAKPTETGGENYRLIEGITPDKSYTVNGLQAGGLFFCRVKTVYVNGTESRWSNTMEVRLKEASFIEGDVNGDGEVNIADVTALIDYVLSGDPAGINVDAADINNDGAADVKDVLALIDKLLAAK